MPKRPTLGAVDDPHRKPGDRDRGALVARSKRAADEGRIAPADRDIRLANVASAQSMSELDLMARDLDQLEAALTAGRPAPPAAPAAPTPASPSPALLADKVTDQAVTVARTTVRSISVVTILILALVGIGFSASAWLGSLGSDDNARSDELFAPEPIPSGATGGAVDEPTEDSGGTQSPDDSAYALTVPGIQSFLADYRAKFDTTLVVDLTLYDDYAIVEVTQAGKKRHAGFLFQKDKGWQDFGGVQANFPGSRLVDLQALDVPALVRNIAEARRTLNVEDVSQTYAIVRHYSGGDEVPSVDIHVSNEYRESGYLATRLDGSVERAYPYEG